MAKKLAFPIPPMCACGLPVVLHFVGRGRKIGCDEAKRNNPKVEPRPRAFADALERARKGRL